MTLPNSYQHPSPPTTPGDEPGAFLRSKPYATCRGKRVTQKKTCPFRTCTLLDST